MSEVYTDPVARKMRLEGLQRRINLAEEHYKWWNRQVAWYQEQVVLSQETRDYWLFDIEQAKEEMRQIGEGAEP